MPSSIVTIDGPAASGKSTVARRVASALGYIYVDSGALYRGITWKALQAGVDTSDRRKVVQLMERTAMDFAVEKGRVCMRIDGVDPGAELRTDAVNEYVSDVAANPEVRAEVVKRLRDMKRFGTIVMEGRDIGSVVFPHAGHKFYLDADPAERARRRHSELAGKRSLNVEVGRVLDSLRRRDARDSGRETAPLTVPPGAVAVDTTRMSIDEVVDFIVRSVG
jgi:CMP/dCMP kinase